MLKMQVNIRMAASWKNPERKDLSMIEIAYLGTNQREQAVRLLPFVYVIF